MDDILTLGAEVAPWQIKDISVALRTQITKAARQQDCTIAEWLHGYFQRHGIDGQQFEPVKLAPVGPAIAAPGSGGPADTMATVVAAIGALAATRGVPRATRQAVDATALMVLSDIRRKLGAEEQYKGREIPNNNRYTSPLLAAG